MYLIDHDYTPAKVWEIKNFELEKKNDCFIYSTLLEPESRHKIKSSNFYEIRYPDYPFDHIKIAYFETNKGEIQILQRGDHDFNFYIKSNNVEIHDKEKFDLGNKTMEFIIPGYD